MVNFRFENPIRFGTDLWDPSHRFETSWLLPPYALAAVRAVFVRLQIPFSIFKRGTPSLFFFVFFWGPYAVPRCTFPSFHTYQGGLTIVCPVAPSI